MNTKFVFYNAPHLRNGEAIYEKDQKPCELPYWDVWTIDFGSVHWSKDRVFQWNLYSLNINCHLLDDRCSILEDIWVPMQCFSLYITQIPVHLDQIKEGRKAKT